MQQDYTLENGRLSDGVVLRSIAKLRQDVPDLDETAVEAHMTVFRAYAAYFDAVSGQYERLGLSHARFNMLRWLYHAEACRLSISELGARLEASIPNVMRMVQALEAEGWVRRLANEADRRVTFVEMTEAGLQRFRVLLPEALRIWQEVQSGLTRPEQALLSHLLTKLRMSLLTRYIGRDSLVQYRLEEQRRRRGRRGHGDTSTP